MPSAAPLVEHLEAAIDAWNIGVYEWRHASGGFVASDRLLEMYGCSGPTDALTLCENVHPDDRAKTRNAFRAALDPEGSGRVEIVHRVVQAGGALSWLHHRVTTRFEIIAGRRRAMCTTGSVMDVTERQHIEQELRRTQSRFEEAVRGAQFGIFEHNHVEDPKAEHVYWSPRLREIFGFEQDEAASAKNLLSRVHPDDIEDLHAAVVRAHNPDGDGYYDVEHRYLHPTLGLRWLLTRSSTYFGEVNGKRVPVRTVGAIVDVTARRKSEQEHEQRAQILDATSDFVAMAEPNGRLVYLNRAGREFLGFSLDAELPERSLQAVYAPGSRTCLLEEGLPQAARDGVWRGETEFMRNDGAIVPMSQVLLSHRGRDGEVVLYSTIARDVSRERQLEEKIRQSQKMEAVGRLAGGIAHDFNNMLFAVLSFAHLAASEVGEQGKGYPELQEIIAAGQRAAALTQQLLAFSRRQVLRPRVVDVKDILSRMAPMIRRLVGEDIDVVLGLADYPVRVKVDPTHLEQVVLNLSINARDAMDQGGRLSIGCRCMEFAGAPAAGAPGDLTPGRYAIISVADEGSGMDAETRARIFEPFFTTKEPGRGTGLGLATVFGIVKQSGGSMAVESSPGEGSVFEAFIPSSDEPLTEMAPLRAPDQSGRSGVILVTEDDASVRQVVVAVLQRAGYSVLDAAGPHQALALASAHDGPIDLLLTDVVMPVMSGKDLAERIVALRPNLPVLYMSGYTDKAIVHRGVLDAGIQLLAKPITPEQLLAAVGTMLDEARAKPSLGSAASRARAVSLSQSSRVLSKPARGGEGPLTGSKNARTGRQ